MKYAVFSLFLMQLYVFTGKKQCAERGEIRIFYIDTFLVLEYDIINRK